MAMERVEMVVLRHGRTHERQYAHLDTRYEPDDMRDLLVNYLESNHWAPGTWPQFEADFYTARGRKTVRAVP